MDISRRVWQAEEGPLPQHKGPPPSKPRAGDPHPPPMYKRGYHPPMPAPARPVLHVELSSEKPIIDPCKKGGVGACPWHEGGVPLRLSKKFGGVPLPPPLVLRGVPTPPFTAWTLAVVRVELPTMMGGFAVAVRKGGGGPSCARRGTHPTAPLDQEGGSPCPRPGPEGYPPPPPS
jgi:hypothetical protein